MRKLGKHHSNASLSSRAVFPRFRLPPCHSHRPPSPPTPPTTNMSEVDTTATEPTTTAEPEAAVGDKRALDDDAADEGVEKKAKVEDEEAPPAVEEDAAPVEAALKTAPAEPVTEEYADPAVTAAAAVQVGPQAIHDQSNSMTVLPTQQHCPLKLYAEAKLKRLCDVARPCVRAAAADPAAAGGDEQASDTIDCPAGVVGRVIGKGGETIKGLQAQSGAHITIDQNYPEGEPRKIAVSGPKGCVEAAMRMIADLLQAGAYTRSHFSST